MIKASVQIKNMKQVQDEFRDIKANQIPFATARALTMTAQDAQKLVRQTNLPGRFTLRQPTFLKAGVRITAATKARLESVVGDIDAFMELQEQGGVKIAYRGFIAVPIIGGAKSSVRALVSDENRPHAVMERGGFIRNGIMYAVAFKQGRRGRLNKNIGGIQKAAVWERKIVPMYVLVKQAAIKPRYGFVEAVDAIVQKNFASNFGTAFRQAVRTARH